jgi:hypothetical protein
MTTAVLRRVSPSGWWLLSGAVGLAAWMGLAAWTPSGGGRDSICFFRDLTGMSCASCGLTRAVALLAKGRWGAAVALHPLAPLFVAEAVAGWLLWLAVIRRWARWPSAHWISRWLIANAVALLAVWIVRIATGTLPR